MQPVERILSSYISGLLTIQHNHDIARLGRHCLDGIGQDLPDKQNRDHDTLAWRAGLTNKLSADFETAFCVMDELSSKERLALIATHYFVKRHPSNFIGEFIWLCNFCGEDPRRYYPVKPAGVIRFDKNLAELIGISHKTLSDRKLRGLRTLRRVLAVAA